MIQDILDLGADKVSLNTAALRDPTLISRSSSHFGSQCIVIAIDVKRIQNQNYQRECTLDASFDFLKSDISSAAEVYSHGGRHNLGLDALKWMSYCESLGAGEILLTSMDCDGTQDGYDTELLQLANDLLSIPVIASGGAGTINHINDALQISDAALLASILHYDQLSIHQIKSTLNTDYNLPIRLI